MPSPPLPPALQALLAKPNPAVMGTVTPNGDPLTVATWYLWEDDGVLLNLDAGRKRLAHLRHDPRISLTALDAQSWYTHVTVHGRATAIEDDLELQDIDRISRHYRDRPYPDRRHGRVSVRMEVERWHAWGTHALTAGSG